MLTALYTILAYDPRRRLALASRSGTTVLLVDAALDVHALNLARQTYVHQGVENYQPVRDLESFVRQCGWHAEPAPADTAPPEPWLNSQQAADLLGIPVKRLRRLAAEAPADLPGAPESVGTGTQRRHLRWPRATLSEWYAALRARQSAPAPAPPPRRRSRRKAGPPPAAEPVDWDALKNELLDD